MRRIPFGWALAWCAIFITLNVIITTVRGVPTRQLGSAALAGLVYGLITGTVFTVLVRTVERRRTLDQVSLVRVALWGVVAALALVPVAVIVMMAAGISIDQQVTPLLARLPVVAVLGAACALATAAVARRRQGVSRA